MLLFQQSRINREICFMQLANLYKLEHPDFHTFFSFIEYHIKERWWMGKIVKIVKILHGGNLLEFICFCCCVVAPGVDVKLKILNFASCSMC